MPKKSFIYDDIKEGKKRQENARISRAYGRRNRDTRRTINQRIPLGPAMLLANTAESNVHENTRVGLGAPSRNERINLRNRQRRFREENESKKGGETKKGGRRRKRRRCALPLGARLLRLWGGTSLDTTASLGLGARAAGAGAGLGGGGSRRRRALLRTDGGGGGGLVRACRGLDG
mgnify:CR=1 FL=1